MPYAENEKKYKGGVCFSWREGIKTFINKIDDTGQYLLRLFDDLDELREYDASDVHEHPPGWLAFVHEPVPRLYFYQLDTTGWTFNGVGVICPDNNIGGYKLLTQETIQMSTVERSTYPALLNETVYDTDLDRVLRKTTTGWREIL